MQQHIAGPQGGERIAAAPQPLGNAGREGRIFQFGAIHQVVQRHQAIHVDRPGNLVQIVRRERKLLQQVGENLIRTVVRGFQAHRIAVAPRGQLTLDRAQQVIDFFLLDEQVAVARDAELVAAAHLHAGEQRRYVGFDNRSQENEVAAAEFIGQSDQARQRARRLYHGEAAVASKAVFAFHHDREIQTLVENFWKWPSGVERQRAQTGSTSRVK